MRQVQRQELRFRVGIIVLRRELEDIYPIDIKTVEMKGKIVLHNQSSCDILIEYAVGTVYRMS